MTDYYSPYSGAQIDAGIAASQTAIQASSFAVKQQFVTVANLLSNTTVYASGAQVQVSGIGLYTWASAAATGVIGPDAAGNYWRVLPASDGRVTPEMFGALGNGTTDDTAAMTATGATSFPVTWTGTYLLSSAVTFSQPVLAMSGSYITSSSAVTVTFNGGFDGPLEHVFQGSIAAVFSAAKQPVGYPEWWGAVTDDTGVDCKAALEAGHAALQTMQLQFGIYYTLSTVQFNTSNHTVAGAGMPYVATGGTIIAVQSATEHAIRVGDTTDPGSINAFKSGIQIRDLGTDRTVAVTPPASGSEASAPSGLFIDYALNCRIDRVSVSNNSIGFNVNNVVASYIERCASARFQNGNSATNDIYWAFFLNSTVSGYGLQSVYITRCTSWANPVAQGSKYGLSTVGQFTDIQVVGFEADAHDIGMLIDGTGAGKPSIDNLIFGCVLDQCNSYGIQIQNQPANSYFKITDNYVICKVGATAAYSIDISGSMATLAGNEANGLTGTSAIGFDYISAASIQSLGNTATECKNPIKISTQCVNCQDQIYNATQVGTDAVVLVGAYYCTIAPIINGASGSWTNGVNVDSASHYSEVRTNGINYAPITNILYYNGAKVTALGNFGSPGYNLASGTHI